MWIRLLGGSGLGCAEQRVDERIGHVSRNRPPTVLALCDMSVQVRLRGDRQAPTLCQNQPIAIQTILFLSAFPMFVPSLSW
jgi:hypothetical protein